MVDSLRDQLLKSGIAKLVAREPQRKPDGRGNAAGRKQGPRHARSGEGEIDLAKAYQLRARAQARERRELEQAAAEEARLRRERKAKIRALVVDKALNKTDAEHARHFEYGGKIRRIYVDAEQLHALNVGELGVVQHEGHYLLVDGGVARAVQAIDPRRVALLVEPGADAAAADGVPDDLMW